MQLEVFTRNARLWHCKHLRLNFIPKPCSFACIEIRPEWAMWLNSCSVLDTLLRCKTNVLLENSNSKIVWENKSIHILYIDYYQIDYLVPSYVPQQERWTVILFIIIMHTYSFQWLLLSDWFAFCFSGCPWFISFSYYRQFWLKYHPTE